MREDAENLETTDTNTTKRDNYPATIPEWIAELVAAGGGI